MHFLGAGDLTVSAGCAVDVTLAWVLPSESVQPMNPHVEGVEEVCSYISVMTNHLLHSYFQ